MWGLWEWMLVGAIAALLFGHKVPSLARAMGLSVGSFKEGLAGIRLLLDPDCKPRGLATYHPSFTVFLDGAGEHRWQPSAFDERVAGRLATPGRQEALGQRWEFDVEFSALIQLDPEATTVP